MRATLCCLLSMTASGCLPADLGLFLPIKTENYELPDNRIPTHLIDEASFTASDGVRLVGMLARHEVPLLHPSVLFLHGQGGNIDYFWDWVMLLWDSGYNVFAVDYRGYGKSTGTPTEKGLQRDARAALAFLQTHPHIDANRILIWGYSLGTAVATELAVAIPPPLLTLEAPFSSMSDMAEETSPYAVPAEWVLAAKLDTVGRIGQLRAPLLVLHGSKDQRVPRWMAKRVFEAAPEPKRFIGVPGADHGQTLRRAVEPALQAIGDLAPTVLP